MAGDPNRPALAREGRLGIVAGALLEARGVRALDDDDVESVHVGARIRPIASPVFASVPKRRARAAPSTFARP